MLAFLAPDILGAVGDGTAPAHLTADRLTLGDVIPAGWNDQRLTFGIAARVLSVLCALVSVWRSWVLIPGRSGGEYLPLGQGSRATKLVFLTTDEMTFGKEVVGDIGVDGGELL